MNVGIIGLGLIGGSLGRALVKNTEHRIFATDTSEDAMVKGGLLSAYHERLTKENAGVLDVLIVALTPKKALSVMEEYAPLLKPQAIVSDTCGTKRYIANGMQKLAVKYPELEFIAVHPMAGREYSGIRHSSAGLFEKASFIMVPVSAGIKSRATLKELFVSVGAEKTVVTTPEEHDRIIAYTSQLAHVISNGYMRSPTATSFLGFSAGSFRDMTRVARISPEMWTELFIENKDYLVPEIDVLLANIKALRDAIACSDENKVMEILADGNARKEKAEQERREKQ